MNFRTIFIPVFLGVFGSCFGMQQTEPSFAKLTSLEHPAQARLTGLGHTMICSMLPSKGLAVILVASGAYHPKLLKDIALSTSSSGLGFAMGQQLYQLLEKNKSAKIGVLLVTGLTTTLGQEYIPATLAAGSQALWFEFAQQQAQKTYETITISDKERKVELKLSNGQRLQEIINNSPLHGYNLIIKPYLYVGGALIGLSTCATLASTQVAQASLVTCIKYISPALITRAASYEDSYRIAKAVMNKMFSRKK